jgi:hypothetical protein
LENLFLTVHGGKEIRKEGKVERKDELAPSLYIDIVIKRFTMGVSSQICRSACVGCLSVSSTYYWFGNRSVRCTRFSATGVAELYPRKEPIAGAGAEKRCTSGLNSDDFGSDQDVQQF